MSDNIQVDGIKKLSEEEKRESRKIILETIGEKESPVKEPEQKSGGIFGKKVDGILGFKLNKSAEEEKKSIEKKVDSRKKQEWQDEINKILPKPEAEDAANKKKETANKAPDLLADLAKYEQPAIKKKVENQKEKVEKVGKMTSNAKRSGEKLRPTQEKIERKRSVGLPPPRKKIISKSKKVVNSGTILIDKKTNGRFIFKKKIDFNFKNLEISLNSATRKALAYFAFFIAVAFCCYLFFILTIIKFKPDNAALRYVARYIMIPAIITEDGIIEFYQYQDEIKKINLAGSEADKMIVAKLIIISLYERLNLPFGKSLADLSKSIAYDEEINKAPLERVRKIRELINSQKDFDTVASKYGDEQGRKVFSNDKNDDSDNFKEDLKSLKLGEVSEVIYRPDGYYIFKCLGINDNNKEFSYVIIRPKTLQKYLEETLKNYSYSSLVN